MKITFKCSLESVAFIVSECLIKHGIEAVLSGGAVVSIYTNNEYESKDLDFISRADFKKIELALLDIGFKKSAGRHFFHTETDYFVEFPKPPLAIGERNITEWVTLTKSRKRLKLLTPTHSVMDRLAAYFHWNDKQCLDQALLISKKHPVNMRVIENWSREEGHLEKYKIFRELHRKRK